MRLRVLTLTKHSVFLNVDPSMLIDEVKARLTQDTGIPLNGQRLVFKGQELILGSVEENGINEDDFIVVVVIQPSMIKKPDLKLCPAKSISRREETAAELQDQNSCLPQQYLHSIQPSRHLDVDGDEEEAGLDDDNDLEDVDPDALQQLMDMGFQANRANKALILTRGNTQLAMDWLLEHERDPDIDEPLTIEQIDRLRAGEDEEEYGENTGEGMMMIDPHEAAQRLMELGFAQEDIAYALEATGQDFEAAAAWLLGDYFPPPPPPPPPQGLGDQEPPYITDDPDEERDDDPVLTNVSVHNVGLGPR